MVPSLDKTYEEQLRLIVNSDVFKRLVGQEHHYNTTLDQHIFSVAYTCRKVSGFLKKLGVNVREKELIVAAFCHDLGMADRRDKNIYPFFENNLAFNHGNRSVMYAEEILGRDLTELERNIIIRHMFPTQLPPRYKEGWILIASDKFCTVKDFFKNLNKFFRPRSQTVFKDN